MLFGARQEACTAFPSLLSLASHVICHRCPCLVAEDSPVREAEVAPRASPQVPELLGFRSPSAPGRFFLTAGWSWGWRGCYQGRKELRVSCFSSLPSTRGWEAAGSGQRCGKSGRVGGL